MTRNGGRCTIHLSAEPSNARLVFHTTHAANQLNIHRVVANWCNELTQLKHGQPYLCMEKSVAKVNGQLSQKCGTSRSGFVGTDTQDKMFKQRGTDCVFIMTDSKSCHLRLKLNSSLRICRVHESSIRQHFKTGHDVDDGFWRYDRSMQRV